MSVTYLLDELLEQQRAKREKLRKQIIDSVFKALAKLSERCFFDEAYLFGSLTKPYNFQPTSDIDIGFFGLADKDFFKANAFLSRQLQRDVDVVQLESHRFKDKIVTQGIGWKKQS